jgi:hypothetical protein
MSLGRTVIACLAGLLAVVAAPPLAAAQPFDIGLAANGTRIDAMRVDASKATAPIVVLVGGLKGGDAVGQCICWP